MIRERILRYEKYFFLLVVLANLYPVLNFSFFITLDGPAHLYNANLIKHMLFANNNNVQDYFCFQGWHFTNWTGHLMMACFLLFGPAWLAEKLMMVIILIGLPYAYRWFINNITPHKSLLSYFIFPFTWSQMFYYGFFNFFLGLIFMFILAGIWISPRFSPGFRKWTLLFLFFLLASCSHIFTFFLSIAITTGWTFWKILVPEGNDQSGKFRKRFLQSLKQFAFLFTASLGGLFVLVLFFIHPHLTSHSSGTGMSLIDTLNEIRVIRPLLAMTNGEQMFTAKWFYWLGLMSLVAAIIRVIAFVRNRKGNDEGVKRNSLILPPDYFIGTALIFFALFIIYNIWFEAGLYLNSRYLLLGFFMWIVWLSAQKLPAWFSILSVLVALMLNFTLVVTRQPLVSALSNTAEEFTQIADKVKPGSVVYPVNYSSNWLLYHVVSYLGTERPLVILDNYECEQSFFPLVWKDDKSSVQKELNFTYPYISNVRPNGTKAFDYVLTYADFEVSGQKDYIEFRNFLENKYQTVAVSPSGTIKLYRIKE